MKKTRLYSLWFAHAVMTQRLSLRVDSYNHGNMVDSSIILHSELNLLSIKTLNHFLTRTEKKNDLVIITYFSTRIDILAKAREAVVNFSLKPKLRK